MATLLVAIFCGWIILKSWNSAQEKAAETVPVPEVELESTPSSNEASTPPSLENSAGSDNPSSSSEKKKFSPPTFAEKIKNSQMISSAEYRSQVESNPHGTPPGLINSALQLGHLFDAVTNESEASQYMSHLKNCLSGDTPPSFKSTCYKYADQISKKYASLRKDFNGLKLDEDTQKIIDIKNQGF